IKAAAKGTASGPNSWDGYVAAITSDACVTAQESEGAAIAINLPARPTLYN
ncbi:inositol 2-dehydrogenase, partial [Klebsiella pneumoniae]